MELEPGYEGPVGAGRQQASSESEGWVFISRGTEYMELLKPFSVGGDTAGQISWYPKSPYQGFSESDPGPPASESSGLSWNVTDLINSCQQAPSSCCRGQTVKGKGGGWTRIGAMEVER